MGLNNNNGKKGKGKGTGTGKRGKKGGDFQDDDMMAFYLYPILPIDSPTGPLLHNLVMQLFTAGYFTYTLLDSETPDNKVLETIKLITIALAVIAAIISAFLMLQNSEVATEAKKSMGMISFIVAATAVLVGIISFLTHAEFGLMAWLDGSITLSNVFWIWRSIQQAL